MVLVEETRLLWWWLDHPRLKWKPEGYILKKKLELRMNNGAELQALTSGVWLCKELGHQNICIEINSELVVGWLNAKCCSSWYLWDVQKLFEEELQCLHFSIKYQFKEGNQVVEFLARQNEGGNTKRYYAGDELPNKMQSLICLDKLGIPSLCL